MKTETLSKNSSIQQRRMMIERSLQDVYSYEKQALDLLAKRFEGKEDHPHYAELKALLLDQINDELRDYATNNSSNRRTDDLREGGY